MPDAFHMVRPLATVSIVLLHFHLRLHLESDAIDETCECYRRTGSLTLRQIAIHSKFIVVDRVRSFESDFSEFRCLCRRCRHSSSNAFMLFLCKLQTVLTGRRSIAVKRIENIKIASPQLGAQKRNNLLMNGVATSDRKQIFCFSLSLARSPFLLCPAVLVIHRLNAWQKSK